MALKRASATSISASTGLCLWGMAEDEPPPASSISPPACAISATSWPNLPRLPVTSDSQLARSAMRSRWLCHCGASARPRRSASAARTAGPLPPKLSSVPAAPPNWTTPIDRRSASSRSRCRRRGARQLSMRSATRIGIAGCMRVRPISGRSPKRLARSAKAWASAPRREFQQVEARACAQHKSRVDHVLAGRAEMHVFCMRLSHRLPDLPHQFGHDDAVAGGAFVERRHIRLEVRRARRRWLPRPRPGSGRSRPRRRRALPRRRAWRRSRPRRRAAPPSRSSPRRPDRKG